MIVHSKLAPTGYRIAAEIGDAAAATQASRVRRQLAINALFRANSEPRAPL